MNNIELIESENTIRLITITLPTAYQVTITAIIKNIDPAVDGKKLLLTGIQMEQGTTDTSSEILWHWNTASTVSPVYLPKGVEFH